MDLQELILVCQKWSSLGGAVQEQLADIADGASLSEQNGNALRLIRDFLVDISRYEIEGADDLADQIDNDRYSAAPSVRRAGRNLPDLRKASSRLAALTEVEKSAIVSEEGAATNLHKLDLANTHYEASSDPEDWLLFTI